MESSEADRRRAARRQARILNNQDDRIKRILGQPTMEDAKQHSECSQVLDKLLPSKEMPKSVQPSTIPTVCESSLVNRCKDAPAVM